MPVAPHKVVIIVDRKLGRQIVDVARRFHTWVVESSINTPVIQCMWAEDVGGEVGRVGPGITSFEATESETSEDLCARMAAEVDEHHGEFAQEPPWSEIEVIGAIPSPRLRAVFTEIGATAFVATAGGFVCTR